MADDQKSDVAPITDQRPKPRGVLPRATQTWVMAGLAFLILAIIFFTGHPEPAERPVAQVSAASLAPSPDRLRDYSDRLRVIEARSQQQAVGDTRDVPPMRYQEPAAADSPDPLEAERKRREYESLFASNVVMSRRPDGQRLADERGTQFAASRPGLDRADADIPAAPSLDDVADAVVRAATRQNQPIADSRAVAPADAAAPTMTAARSGERPRRSSTAAIDAAGPLHRVLEGTVIDTVLMNRLDGSNAAPVNCLVTNPIYSHSGQYVLIPAGARVIGETKPVQALGETRLAVTFHRLVLPDGRSYALEEVTGLNQRGDAGLRDQVDHHHWSTFGAAGAVGLINGLSQVLSGAAFGGDGDRTVVITGGAGNAAAQTTGQAMGRYLNRLPTVTIREGHRIKVYLTADLDLPAYSGDRPAPGVRAAGLLAGVRR